MAVLHLNIVAPVVIAALLTGCVQATPTVAPDGRAALTITCSGAAQTMAACIQEAGRRCPRGYDILANSDQRQGHISTQYGAAPVVNRYMLVACRGG